MNAEGDNLVSDVNGNHSDLPNYQQTPMGASIGYKSFADAKPILVQPGDMNGIGKEYRHPLGEGLYCQCLTDDGEACEDVAYWYCDQNLSFCGLVNLFRGCGTRMCDAHCSKQYGDGHHMRLTGWHCTMAACSDRYFEAKKKCCIIAFAIFCVLFWMISLIPPDEEP